MSTLHLFAYSNPSMNYQQSTEYLERLMPTQLSPGLERLSSFLAFYGNPQDKRHNIHVAGTNGKGSVVAMTEECLRRSGIRTGRFTGPHLLNWTERIQTDGHEISENEFGKLLEKLKSLSENFAAQNPGAAQLSWFELVTAMAFFHFQERNVHTAVLEVGLGGRWDATNTIRKSVVSAIVSIGLDHMHILGDTIAAIAREKAEIIKYGVPVVTACNDEALSVIRELATERKAPLLVVAEGLNGNGFSLHAGTGLKEETELLDSVEKRMKQIDLEQTRPEFQRGYQQQNAHVAATLLAIYELQTGLKCLEHFNEAVDNYFWPGRLQYLPDYNLLLDGAHNESGAIALRSSIDELFPNKKIDFILSFYRTKQFEKILTIFLRQGDRVWASEAVGRRAVITAAEIRKASQALCVPVTEFKSLDAALESVLSQAPDERLRVATGSFASVAAALSYLGYKSVEASRSASKPLFV